MVAASAAWGLLFIYFREPLAGSFSLFYAIITFLSLIYFARTRRYRVFHASQMAIGLVLPFLQVIALGGLWNSGGIILWSLISPLGALLIATPRRALRWWLAFLGVLAACSILQPIIVAENNLPQPFIWNFFLLNLATVSFIAVTMLVFFLNQKNTILHLLRIEEKKAEDLLLNILPRDIAAILKNDARTIADQFDGASVLFADMVGFTTLSARMQPVDMVNLLNDIFSTFDALVEQLGLEKIRTIGDNYMVAAGVPRPRQDHAHALARLALQMREYLQRHSVWNGHRIEFRIGINSGPMIGGVIGRKKFVYDIWGDAVNIASRMESHGVPGKIQVTQTTYELIKDQFECEARGLVSVKGKGEIRTWFLLSSKPGVPSPALQSTAEILSIFEQR